MPRVGGTRGAPIFKRWWTGWNAVSPMKCVVTAGPTSEPLDQVRRLTNLSTGRLGVGLADHLVECGCEVILLRGTGGTYVEASRAQRQEVFFTTVELEARLAATAHESVGAVFHVAAVSDFGFGRVYQRAADGQLIERRSGKLSTAQDAEGWLVELRPTPKLIGKLRGWFPRACLVGWKYEVDGTAQHAVARARIQLETHDTDACVVNGPAYGDGYGLVAAVDAAVRHFPDAERLYQGLWNWVADRANAMESR
jgi:phosphopantothenate---cysteine ligase (CTP)